MLNDVVNGGNIPKQWRERRVVLVYKGCGVSSYSERKDNRCERGMVCLTK